MLYASIEEAWGIPSGYNKKYKTSYDGGNRSDITTSVDEFIKDEDSFKRAKRLQRIFDNDENTDNESITDKNNNYQNNNSREHYKQKYSNFKYNQDEPFDDFEEFYEKFYEWKKRYKNRLKQKYSKNGHDYDNNHKNTHKNINKNIKQQSSDNTTEHFNNFSNFNKSHIEMLILIMAGIFLIFAVDGIVRLGVKMI